MNTAATQNVSDGNMEVALSGEILRVLCGSDIHGMAIGGLDDRDEMGVFIEPAAAVVGLGEGRTTRDQVIPTTDHWNSRTQPHGVRSGPGDVDLILYSLRKWMRLATAGNPTVLTVLYAPEEGVLTSSGTGDALRALAPQIVSVHAAHKYLGYLNGQYDRMRGLGKQSRVPNRPELVAAHGYDTKYASHALRLGLQGCEIAETGTLTLPLRQADRDLCVAMKKGEYTFEQSCQIIETVRADLLHLVDGDRTVLRPEPDWDALTRFMCDAHQTHWGWDG